MEKWTDHHLEAELKFAHLFHDGTKDSYDWIACLEAEARRRGWDEPTRKYAIVMDAPSSILATPQLRK